jgi:nitrogen fixation protein FixH
MAGPMSEGGTAIDRQTGKMTGRHVLIWFLGFFVVVFTANGIMTYLAISTFSGLDVPDPYARGRSYGDEISAAAAQNKRAWNVGLSHRLATNGELELVVTAKDASGQSIAGLRVEALIRRPTRAVHDTNLRLREIGSGLYRESVRLPQSGQWLLEINAFRGQTRVYRTKHRIAIK